MSVGSKWNISAETMLDCPYATQTDISCNWQADRFTLVLPNYSLAEYGSA
jgi:hypothetical protein